MWIWCIHIVSVVYVLIQKFDISFCLHNFCRRGAFIYTILLAFILILHCNVNLRVCLIVLSLKIPKGGNQNPYFEEELTTKWPKEKVQKDKQRSTKHTHKTKDRVTRTPPNRGWTRVLPNGMQFLLHYHQQSSSLISR